MDDFATVHNMIRQEPVLAALRRPPAARLVDRAARARQFRDEAVELRAICEDVILDETRQTFRRLAESYERMAASLESAAASA
ncbi:MAG TPA: hypothetical protein VHU18_07305 [Rhizomicrobium sp.]|nr:hypothetical protein [Rhizomicrobium sp.]